MIRTVTLIVALAALPAAGFAALQTQPGKTPTPSFSIGLIDAISPSVARTLEWGCPVSEVVAAATPEDALSRVGLECESEARRAAGAKPDVVDVINTAVVWPDIHVTEVPGGFSLTGTFFLETLVLQRSAPR